MGEDQPRLATPANLSEIEGVVAASYEKYLPRMDKPPAPVGRNYAEAIEKREVWIVGNPVLGLVVLINQSESALLIENIAVHPSAQGTGLGRQLVEFAEFEATARGRSYLTLYTNEAMIENLSLYDHLGFVEIDRRTEDGLRRIYFEKLI